MLPRMARRRHRTSAGFTLTELMAVVAITGILATLGVAMVRDHINVAKSNRALAGMQAVRIAEEAFRAENGRYMNASVSKTSYPVVTPNGTKTYDWRQPDHVDYKYWNALGVINDAPTQYGFLANAGLPGDAYPDLATTNDPTLPASNTDWYVIQAKGDLDGDGVYYQAIITSTTAAAYVERENE